MVIQRNIGLKRNTGVLFNIVRYSHSKNYKQFIYPGLPLVTGGGQLSFKKSILCTENGNFFKIKNTNRLNSRNYSTEPESKKELSTSSTSGKTKKKLTLKEKIKHEVKHYVAGTKLLGYEIKISSKLLWKLISGYELSRRESQQLKRTMKDIFRLVPFSAFLIIPFAELLLPFALKIFPNLLPSTYESKSDKLKKNSKTDEVRSKTKKFLLETLKEADNTTSTTTKDIVYNSILDSNKKSGFLNFFKKLNSTKDSTNAVFTKEEIVNVAKNFKNDIVLDNLSRPQLVAIAKYMSLRPIGTNELLRTQIRMQLKKIIEDDRNIAYEGYGSLLSFDELYQACVVRGIKTFGVSQEDLQMRLKAWLKLRLDDKIPGVLMILSSVYTYDIKLEAPNDRFENLVDVYYDSILKVLSSIPDPVYDITRLEVTEEATVEEAKEKAKEKELEKEKKTERKPAPVTEPKQELSHSPEETIPAFASANSEGKVTEMVAGTAETSVAPTGKTTTKEMEKEEEKEVEVEKEVEKEAEEEEVDETIIKHKETERKLNVLKEQEKMIEEESEEERKRSKKDTKEDHKQKDLEDKDSKDHTDKGEK